MRACVHACVHVRVWVSCSNQQLLGEEEEEREGVGIKSRKRGRGEMRGRERERGERGRVLGVAKIHPSKRSFDDHAA